MTTNIYSYAVLNERDVATKMHTTLDVGLSHQEAERRLLENGKNEVRASNTKWWHILLRQFRSSFFYLLVAAAILSVWLGEMWDGIMITFFLSINASLGFIQEFRSERSLQLLGRYVAQSAKVRRDGKESVVPRSTLVTGDVVIVETGDRLPADLRFVETQNLLLDESALTGESIPLTKHRETLAHIPKEMVEATNLGFSGTTVLHGRGVGVVCATGEQSIFGSITHLTVTTEKISAFEKELQQFSNFTLKLIFATLVIVVFLNIILKGVGTGIGGLLLFAIALAVSVIPEGLPLVMTFSLSRGAIRLARKDVVVRRLSAIEDLGRITILCSDKTGTVTKNELRVTDISPHAKKNLYVAAMLTTAPGNVAKLEPFDNAIVEYISKEQKQECAAWQHIESIPFDPMLRWNANIAKEKNGKTYLFIRGAPDAIMEHCEMTPTQRKEMQKWLETQGRQGLRTLAIAQKIIIHKKNITLTAEHIAKNRDFLFLGSIAFQDPIKKSAIPAITRARELGVALKIITGDDAHVAGAVATKIGLIPSPEHVISGNDFFNLPLAKQYETAERTSVFARMSPEQKFRLIQLLQKHHAVGFLGEGINDAPALKIANVSLVVQSASDIARDAADIVLLKQNLNVIVSGIEEGRTIFANTIKYIKATLASNFGNFYAVGFVSLFINFLPLLPMQILLVNLLSDFPFLGIATDTVDAEEIRLPQRYSVKEILRFATLLGVVSTADDLLFFIIFYRFGPEILQTNWFIGSILTELIVLFSIRTRHLFVRAIRPSGILVLLTGVAAIVTVAIPFFAWGRQAFSFVRPTSFHLLIILGLVIGYFFASEIIKLWYYHNPHLTPKAKHASSH